MTDQETIQAVTSLRDSQIQRFYDTDNKLPLVNILIAVIETNQKMAAIQKQLKAVSRKQSSLEGI